MSCGWSAVGGGGTFLDQLFIDQLLLKNLNLNVLWVERVILYSGSLSKSQDDAYEWPNNQIPKFTLLF